MKPPMRLESRLFTLRHPIYDALGNITGEHVFELQVGYGDGKVVEIAFAGRGKIGHGLDMLMQDLGIWVSRVIQNRDPETGKATGGL